MRSILLLAFLFFSTVCHAQTKATTDNNISSFLFNRVDSLSKALEATKRKIRSTSELNRYVGEAVDFLLFLQRLESGDYSQTSLPDSGSYVSVMDGQIDSGNIDVFAEYLVIFRFTDYQSFRNSDTSGVAELFRHFPKLNALVNAGKLTVTPQRMPLMAMSSAPQMVAPKPYVRRIAGSTANTLQLQAQMNEIKSFMDKGCMYNLISDYLVEENQKNYTPVQKINNRKVLIDNLKKYCKK